MSKILSKDGVLKLRVQSSVEQVLQAIQQASSEVSIADAAGSGVSHQLRTQKHQPAL